MISAILSGFLACVGPTLSFAGVNAAWFSSAQILGALAASACLGVVAGAALGFLPPPVAGAGTGLLFAIMSERLLYHFCPRIPARLAAALLISAFCGATAFFGGMLSLCAILLTYALFALWDLRKRWNLPKEPLFSAEHFSKTPNAPEEAASSLVLKERPNIYVLFLESFHSREALRTLYDSDDDGLTDFLRECGFTVFENSLSNACWTQHSMQVLLRMAHYEYHAKGTPEAIRHLLGNGYEIQFLDDYMYTFKTYLPWAAWHNFTIPNWILWLYSTMLPLFMQSKILMRITGNIDPFTDRSNYAGVRGALQERMAKSYAHPQCYVIRFGAHHVNNQYRWSRDTRWPEHYLPTWHAAAANVRDMVSLILRHDPKACIVAMGDHGPHMYEDVWRGASDCNAAMAGKGVAPSLVCLDLAGVLVAVRPPDAAPLPQQTMSPCNLFRLVFEILGGTGPCLTRIPNTTYHYDSRYPRPFVLAREGVPLERWEVSQDAERIGQQLEALEREPDSPEKVCSLAIALEYGGQVEAAGTLLLNCLKRTGNITLLGVPLGSVLLRQGKAKEVLEFLEPELSRSHDPKLLEIVLWAMTIVSGSAREATAVLSQKAGHFAMDDDACLELQATLQQRAGQLEEANATWSALTAKPFSIQREHYERQIRAVCAHARCLEAIGKTPEALALLDNLLDTTKYPNHEYNAPLWNILGLSLRRGDWEKTLRRFQTAFSIMTIPYPATLPLWYAGCLEQAGDYGEAFKVLADAVERNANVPLFTAQAGLFLIRLRNGAANLRDVRKQGYAYLRQQGEMLRPIFDSEWYSQKYASIIPKGMKADQHFLHYGRLLGLDPSPYLNTVFYLITQPDILQGGYDPLWHFIICDPYENRDPSLFFHIPAYLARHRDVDWTKINPLVHYLTQKNTTRIK